MKIDAFLADSVVSAEGKLYVQGAGWNMITTAQLPSRHDRVGIGVLIEVPYTATNQSHKLELTLEDSDGMLLPLGEAPPGLESEDGKVRRFGTQFNIGRPPTIQPGDDQIVAFAININGLPLERANQYAFVIRIDGEEMSRLRFRVNQHQQVGPTVA